MDLNKLITKRIKEYALNGDAELLEQYGFLFNMITKEYVEAINYSRCCETVKDKCTHTFEVDLNNEQVQKQRCEYIEQIHALPTRLFMYNPKTDEYIELKP